MTDVTLLLKVLLLGVVEGLTEFLPISSTGHLILVGDLVNFNDERAKVFQLVIQTGAMLAVIWEYRARFAAALGGIARDQAARRFWLLLAAAFMPAAVIGLLFGGLIKANLFGPVPVALAFIVGGLIILWVERRGPARTRVESVDRMTVLDALKVGFAQCFALIPGVSRSGATIIGGMLFGLSRPAATEFSFFLAVPTLMAAGAYDFYNNRALFAASDLGMLLVGSLAAFVSAFLVIRWLIGYVATHDFQPFAWYRLVFGLAVLLSAYTGAVQWSAP